MRSIKIAASLQRLFESYQTAFLVLSPQALCQCYRIPCDISDADGQIHYDSLAALHTKFIDNCTQFAEQGLEDVTFQFVSIVPKTEHLFEIRVRWQLQLAQQRLECVFDYCCQQQAQQWYIIKAKQHGCDS